MVTTRSMSRKMMNSCGGIPWSNLNHDLLYLVMMRLGVIDFLSFSGVCKSWRSIALSNRQKFMASKPPMLMYTSYRMTCYLQDFEGRRFKTIIPQLVGRKYVGLTCGYLILSRENTRKFWLVNPITRHELNFPNLPFDVGDANKRVRAVLVFSSSINRRVFVMTRRLSRKIWFSIEGTGAWNHVSSSDFILNLHVFKGKIYTLNFSSTQAKRLVCEMAIVPMPKLTELDMHFVAPTREIFNFISSDENLYLMKYMTGDTYKVYKLGFDQLNCVPCEKMSGEYALFYSSLMYGVFVKRESWDASWRFFDANKRGKDELYVADHWYFFQDCLNVTLIK